MKNSKIESILSKVPTDTEETSNVTYGCHVVCHNNVVSEEKLKEVQQSTLRTLKEYLSKTYGPMGSYSAIITGNDQSTIMADYSKDGLKVLKHIIFNQPIELSLQTEVRDICQHVEKNVGDGTTSAVILSSLIYDELLSIMKDHKLPPRKLVKCFQQVVDACKNEISGRAREITLEDVYKICMISTNGNEDISKMIMKVYEDYGFNIDIDVTISNDPNTKIREYDGLTIEQGYSDPAHINNLAKGSSEIHNAKVYSFQDPVDTIEMYAYFEKIIYDNIMGPASQGQMDKIVPTVIITPTIGRDGSSLLTQMVQMLYEYDARSMTTQKPPILIITNLSGTTEGIALDIARLCDCKYIKKYLDPNKQKQDQEAGIAPTMETIHNFAGEAELVSADMDKTKFINPKGVITNPDALGSLIKFLEAEIKNGIAANADDLDIGRLKRRVKALKCNIVEFMVGGITVSDRDSLRDLVEDAVKNCASASEYGVGNAANFEGFRTVSNFIYKEEELDIYQVAIVEALFRAYFNATRILYGTVLPEDQIDDMIVTSLESGKPYNVIDLFENGNEAVPSDSVLCSIRTDIEILDAISKIITMMVTSNQCLLQSPNINIYEK